MVWKCETTWNLEAGPTYGLSVVAQCLCAGQVLEKPRGLHAFCSRPERPEQEPGQGSKGRPQSKPAWNHSASR